jgi:FkbM family methyltransferase
LSLFSTLRFIAAQHAFSSQQPIKALARFLSWQLRARLSGKPLLVQWTNKCKVWMAPGLRGATGNYYCGLHEFEDMSFLLHLLRPDDGFADVGANTGTYTVLAAAHVGAYTIAFEPVPEALYWLQQNISANQAEERVRIVPEAVSCEVGTVHFTRHLDAMNHMLEEAAPDSLSTACTTLDETAADHQPLLIKIDVEGNENLVLQGATRLLRQPSLKAMIVETTTQPFRRPEAITTHEWLVQQGFGAYTYEPFGRHLRQLAQPHHHNTLYLRDLPFIEERLRSAPAFNLWNRAI